MRTQDIAIVSIHPDPAQPLALDLKEVLGALKPYCERWIWCVRNLDWLGENSEAVCQRVEAAGLGGLWMSSQDLLGHARGIYQTIEGEFLAFPREIDLGTVSADEVNLGAFPESRAELAIVAVDGGYFEVYAKDPKLLTALKQFKDVRDENPGAYF
jgi:hypothetical protein